MREHISAGIKPTREPDYAYNEVCHYWFEEMRYYDHGGVYFMRDLGSKLEINVNGKWSVCSRKGKHAQEAYESWLVESIILKEEE